MKKILGIVLTLIMLMSVTIAVASNPTDMKTNHKKVIIGFVDRPNQADENMIRGLGGKTKYTYHIINAKAVEISEQAIDRIKENPRVAYVEEDAKMYALGETLPWGVDRIDAEIVHADNNKGAGVKVAIIDTGIDRDHPDLNVAGGINYVVGSPFDGKSDDNWDDDNGHGTHCAGIVAAIDNDIGVIGVAPKASLYAVKVLSSSGSGWTSDVIAGIEWTIDPNGDTDTSDRMDVISMSLGGGYSESMEDACNNAYNAGIVVVASAGNSGPGDDTVGYPAKYDSVIAVSATTNTDDDDLADFSSRGPEVELAAPGVSIYSTIPGGYDTKSGTSMACPHVSGTAALVIASGITDKDGNGRINDEVRTRLQETAEDLGAKGKDNLYGYGLVDAEKAAEAAPGEDTTPPTISDLTPANGTFVNTGTPTISATVTDASGINETSIIMSVDGATVIHSYDSETGIVSYAPTTSLTEDSHTAALEVKDTVNNQAIESWSFTVDTIPPAQVTGLTVSTASSSQLGLAWDANTETDLVDHYNVYRSTTSGGFYELVASPTTNSYSDTGLAASTTYYYTVTAVDSADNEGSASEEANGTTSEDVANVMHVSNITMWYTTAGPNYFINTKVTILDSEEAPVAEATVYIEMTLPDDSKASGSGSTNGDGTVTFKLKSKQTGTYNSTVTNVEKSDWEYNSGANVETSKTLTVP